MHIKETEEGVDGIIGCGASLTICRSLISVGLKSTRGKKVAVVTVAPDIVWRYCTNHSF